MTLPCSSHQSNFCIVISTQYCMHMQGKNLRVIVRSENPLRPGSHAIFAPDGLASRVLANKKLEQLLRDLTGRPLHTRRRARFWLPWLPKSKMLISSTFRAMLHKETREEMASRFRTVTAITECTDSQARTHGSGLILRHPSVPRRDAELASNPTSRLA